METQGVDWKFSFGSCRGCQPPSPQCGLFRHAGRGRPASAKPEFPGRYDRGAIGAEIRSSRITELETILFARAAALLCYD